MPVTLPVRMVTERSDARNADGVASQTLVTIVEAAVGRFLGQSAYTSSTNLTVTLHVGLDGPTPLPTTMGLRLSDPLAAVVTPPSVTWRPGEMGAKQFKLRMQRAARPNALGLLWAEALPVTNLLFANATLPRVAVQVPAAAFYVVQNHVVFRNASSAAGDGNGGNSSRGGMSKAATNNSGGNGGGGGSSGLGTSNSSTASGAELVSVPLDGLGSTPALDSVTIAVRRASPNPFPSSLNYTVVVLQALGCPIGVPCAAAVRGNGTLRFQPDDDVAYATVLLSWTALPYDTTLRVGLQLTPTDNAEVLAAPANSTALFVYDAALHEELIKHAPGTALLPVLGACAGGGGFDLVPSVVQPLPAPSPSSEHPSNGTQAREDMIVQAELRVPYGQNVAAVLLPLSSAAETVVVLQTSCSPPPIWQTVVLPAAVAAANGSSGGGNGTGTGPAGGGSAYARWTLPPEVKLCSATLGVYSPVQQSMEQDGDGRGLASGLPPPAPSPGGVNTGRGLLGSSTAISPAPSPGGSQAPSPPRPSSPAASSPSSAAAGSSLSVVNMLQVRSYNLSLRPLTDPHLLASLALALRNESRGRCLPLCGAPQPLLMAAAAANVAPGSANNASQPNAKQLAAAAALLALAIRGDPAAVVKLQVPRAAGASSRLRLLRSVLEVPGRWLADFATAWRVPLPFVGLQASTDDRALGTAGAAAIPGALARRHASQGASTRQRLLKLDGTASPNVLPEAASQLPSSPEAAPLVAPSGPDDGPPPDEGGAPTGPASPRQLPAASPVTQLGPLPEAGPSPLQSRPPAPSSPPLGTAANGVPATAPDGFAMSDGQGGTVYVLFNQQYLDWCIPDESQVVDLALLAAPGEEMMLEASSQGQPLRHANGGLVAVGAATRAELAAEREAASTAAAAAGNGPARPAVVGSGGQVGGDGSSMSLLSDRSSAGALPPKQASGDIPAPTDGSAGGNTSAPGSSPGGPSDGAENPEGADDGQAGMGCLDDSARLTPDRRVSVSLLAPDGVSNTTVLVDLYVDYAAAAAAAIAAAAKCIDAAGAGGTPGDGITAGNATAAAGARDSSGAGGSATASPAANPAKAGRTPPPAPSPPAALRLPLADAPVASQVSLFQACQLCGPGTFGTSPNASACQPCGPGSFSADLYNTACLPCPPGSFTVLWSSPACRLCPAGSFTARNGSTSCSLCPGGTTTMSDGAASCIAAPPPPSAADGSQYALLVSFQVLLNVSQRGDPSPLGANTTGIDASPDSIVRLLVAADTAEALRIPPTQVRVSLHEVSPSAFLVNVSATLPFGQSSTSGAAGGSGASAPADSSPSKEVDADTLINRLVSNPDDSFPRTKQATGGSLQVQYVERQVVSLDGRGGGVNPHVVVWPTLAGTAMLAVVLGFACSRYCRRRRGGRTTASLPPLSDAFGRLWAGDHANPPPVYLMYGQMPAVELQDLPGPSAAPRHRRGGSKSGLPGSVLGLAPGVGSQGMLSHSASASTTDLEVLAAMYTRDTMAGPRI
ncbi:hypothetical protein GPECTOR_35g835 [Gonium pectorale]|uniref:Tyrosine-protein kinase ephrin type A/B receptor-like domain-containing protein n=1 Tax=Gonium pectorale TaxID=33097 RepID=A0A150GC15_GONPE|nr:hypothetical protein GPECTOR_35g835 [Gonium pectorale]|eukprot:KXZ47397.1 hypothetical protein GPECTOR_35g835 [Gonium pectorale]